MIGGSRGRRGTAGPCVCEDRTRRATSDAASVRPIKELRRHAFALSRRDAPKSCVMSPSRDGGGRRESRVRAAPAVSRAICAQEHAHEHTGSAENIRPSLRSGFTAYFVLSPVNGLSCHRRHADRSTQLDASIGASGPHDFAVRISHARQSQLSRPPHPTARFVTIASRPSCRVRRAEKCH